MDDSRRLTLGLSISLRGAQRRVWAAQIARNR